MPSGGDAVVRKRNITVCDFSREFDLDTADRARTFRNGEYPREGYVSGETNPLVKPRRYRRPPPMRGC